MEVQEARLNAAWRRLERESERERERQNNDLFWRKGRRFLFSGGNSGKIEMGALPIRVKWAILCSLMSVWSWIGLVSSSSSTPTCNPFPNPDTFLQDLHLRCPVSISVPLPIKMDGASFEQALSSMSLNVYTAVLFYDSGSPFSSGIRSKFDMLSSMFPQISHIAVEQSLTMPSLFSRYGIHSLPVLFIVNQTAQMRYYGPKDLHSLTYFYSRTTGLQPVDYHDHDDSNEIVNGQILLQPWYRSSFGDLIMKEPYLLLAILFLVLRTFLLFCPEILSRVAALWILCKREFNMGIFGESSQLVGRVLHLIDVKRVWSKLKLCKTRNFQKRARSARVWASSLASVSLGETSRPLSSTE